MLQSWAFVMAPALTCPIVGLMTVVTLDRPALPT